MKSLTGKFTSVRGWTLLLALLLGAGMMISACGDEEVPTPTAPAPTPTPTPTPTPPPTPEPEPTGPETPANLRVSGTGSDYIEWTWTAVEGALGYQGQFSAGGVFTDADSLILKTAAQTSHRIENLSAQHDRVFSGAVRLWFSDRSAVQRLERRSHGDDERSAAGGPALRSPGISGAPPRATTRSPSSGTRLTTLRPTRSSSARTARPSWSDASCGDEGSVVEDTNCTASGLDEGTDYEFRVRGIPADDDTANVVGAWAETDGTTTGGPGSDHHHTRWDGRVEHPLAQRRRQQELHDRLRSGTGRATPCTRRPCWQWTRHLPETSDKVVDIFVARRQDNARDSGQPSRRYASMGFGNVDRPWSSRQ